MSDPTEAMAQRVLNQLATMSFEDCHQLTREFKSVPTVPGLYAVRHRVDGILYIGLGLQLRRRFRDNGHKAFFWAFLDYYSPDDVRIAIALLEAFQDFRQSEDLEARMIRLAQPRYNVRSK
jgi:excinuclease UvrABC nuclease subunit